MTRQPPPADADLLCQACGYILNGLPAGAACPECGTPTESADPLRNRPPTPFEVSPNRHGFVQTVGRVIVSPSAFFASLQPELVPADERFLRTAHRVSAGLLALACSIHFVWLATVMGVAMNWTLAAILVAVGLPIFFIFAYFALQIVTRMVGYFSVLEGRFWGFRVWPDLTRRVLCYHAGAIVPVSLFAAGAVVGFFLLGWASSIGVLRGQRFYTGAAEIYLFTLAAITVVGIGYLFVLFVIAMRAVRYKNRVPRTDANAATLPA